MVQIGRMVAFKPVHGQLVHKHSHSEGRCQPTGHGVCNQIPEYNVYGQPRRKKWFMGCRTVPYLQNYSLLYAVYDKRKIHVKLYKTMKSQYNPHEVKTGFRVVGLFSALHIMISYSLPHRDREQNRKGDQRSPTYSKE